MSTVLTIRLEEHHTSQVPLPEGFDVDGLRGYLTGVWQSRRLLADAALDNGEADLGEHKAQLLELLPGGWVRARN